MSEVVIKIPDDMAKIGEDISDTIYIEALKEVAKKRLPYKKKQLNNLRRKIKTYDVKYGKSYEEFSQNFPDTTKAHEDWIEWTYLIKLADELENRIKKLNC